MVGLPYANPNDVELKERIRFAAAASIAVEGDWSSHCGAVADAGQEYYERLCMRAVNQCIGRAIRHRNDHAAILLLDQRYARPHTLDALPAWITGRRTGKSGGGAAQEATATGTASSATGVLLAPNFGTAQAILCRFFREHRNAGKKLTAKAAGAEDSDSGED